VQTSEHPPPLQRCGLTRRPRAPRGRPSPSSHSDSPTPRCWARTREPGRPSPSASRRAAPGQRVADMDPHAIHVVLARPPRRRVARGEVVGGEIGERVLSGLEPLVQVGHGSTLATRKVPKQGPAHTCSEIESSPIRGIRVAAVCEKVHHRGSRADPRHTRSRRPAAAARATEGDAARQLSFLRFPASQGSFRSRLPAVLTALDNGQRSPRKLLAAVVRRLALALKRA
jgi:hypothetical protein